MLLHNLTFLYSIHSLTSASALTSSLLNFGCSGSSLSKEAQDTFSLPSSLTPQSLNQTWSVTQTQETENEWQVKEEKKILVP